MADQLDPEQIARASEALEQLINGFGRTKTSAEKLKDEQEAFGKKLGKTVTDLGSSLYKGEKGVTQFGNAVESVATALSSLAAIAAMVNPALRALAMLTTGLAVFAKGLNAAAKQGDALYKTYQDLGRAGATAADGISGVFRNMQNLGYGIEELDKMVALVSQNSETLAKFSMTAADGTNAFAQGMAQIQRDGGLRLLGKTTDDINSAGAAFIRQSVRAGLTQKDIGDKLGAQTKSYVMELDRLQRLTGMSADALQKQQDEAMAEDAYNDVMSELKQRALAGDKVAEAQIEKIITMQTKLGKEGSKQLVMSIGGDIEAGSKIFMAMPSLMRNVMDESVDVNTTMNEAVRDAGNTVSNFGRLSRLAAGAVRDTIGPLYEQREFYAANKDFDIAVERAKKQTAVQDTSTKALTEAQIANMNSRDAMQAFIQQGVAPATVALSKLAQAASGAAGGAAGAVGAPTGGAAAGSKAPGTMNYKKELYGIGAGATLEGLPIKAGATSGGEHTDALASLAQRIYKELGGDIVQFTGLNDGYARDKNSKHPQGRALDFTISDASKSAQIAALVRGMPGVSYVQDEYLNPSPRSSGNHIHAEVSAANGAILSGPMSGYRPNLTMHGTEAIVPLNSPAAQSAFGSSDQTSLMSAQLDKLDELVRVMQNQVSVSTKILQAAN
jgi:hypothetical protein